MPTLPQDREHSTPTQRSKHRYLFTAKHHGLHPDAAQWQPSLSLDQEFSVFDLADVLNFSDGDSRLYGILSDGEMVRELGTLHQQLAEFRSSRGAPWHGFPLWPIQKHGPQNRRGEHMRPPKAVFVAMEQQNLITTGQRKRLFRGDHI